MEEKVQKLKDIIFDLKMRNLRNSIPAGHCPYAYYATDMQNNRDCDGECGECKDEFFGYAEAKIKEWVESL